MPFLPTELSSLPDKNTKLIGDKAMVVVLAEFVKRDVPVLLPWGDLRYDLAIDIAGELLRVQVKSAARRVGCIIFKTQSLVYVRGRRSRQRSYTGEADYFGVYDPVGGDVYLVPVEGAPKSHMRLRVDPAHNSQTKGIKWAANFLLTPQLERLYAEVAQKERAIPS
jgi:hypothetical protein